MCNRHQSNETDSLLSAVREWARAEVRLKRMFRASPELSTQEMALWHRYRKTLRRLLRERSPEERQKLEEESRRMAERLPLHGRRGHISPIERRPRS